jgi:hypothetical protein
MIRGAPCPLVPPPGAGLYYPSPHGGQYWCLNADQYYRDIFGAPGDLLGELVHGLLVALLALAEFALVGGFVYLGVYLTGRWAYARWAAWRFHRTGDWPGLLYLAPEIERPPGG